MNTIFKSFILCLFNVIESQEIITIATGFYDPSGVSGDSNGNVFVAQNTGTSGSLTKISFNGNMTSKTSVGGVFSYPRGVFVDNFGNIFVADTYNHAVKKIDTTGSISTVGSGFRYPTGVCVDSTGNVFVADNGNNAVKKVDQNGVITTVGRDFAYPVGVFVDFKGNLYVADTLNNAIKRMGVNGVISTIGYGFNNPYGVYFDDSSANIFVADTGNNAIKRIDANGVISIIGSGFSGPFGVCLDSNGNIIVADTGHGVVKKIFQSKTIASFSTIVKQSQQSLSTNTSTSLISSTVLIIIIGLVIIVVVSVTLYWLLRKPKTSVNKAAGNTENTNSSSTKNSNYYPTNYSENNSMKSFGIASPKSVSVSNSRTISSTSSKSSNNDKNTISSTSYSPKIIAPYVNNQNSFGNRTPNMTNQNFTSVPIPKLANSVTNSYPHHAAFNNSSPMNMNAYSTTTHQSTDRNTTFLKGYNTTVVEQTNQLSLPGHLRVENDSCYRLRSKLGNGGMGDVYDCEALSGDLRKRAENKKIAAKVMTAGSDGGFLQEVAIMALFVNHENFAQLIGYHQETKVVLMILYPMGSFDSYIRKTPNRSLLSTIQVINGTFRAIHDLHSCGIVHNDIKPANILLEKSSEKFIPKLTDFGVSNIIESKMLYVKAFEVHNIRGLSISYAAPERLAKIKFVQNIVAVSKSADTYSMAIVIVESLTGQSPWG